MFATGYKLKIPTSPLQGEGTAKVEGTPPLRSTDWRGHFRPAERIRKSTLPSAVRDTSLLAGEEID